jgi:hypothetical protein
MTKSWNLQLNSTPSHVYLVPSQHLTLFAPVQEMRSFSTTSAMRMAIHLPAVCEIGSGSTLSQPCRMRAAYWSRAPSGVQRARYSQDSATACEIINEVRANLTAGLEV